MSASALLALAADSNMLLGTSHDLAALRSSHSAKLAQQRSQQQRQQQEREQQRVLEAERRATQQLFRTAGVDAEVANAPSSIERRGGWTDAERDELRSSLTQQQRAVAHHKRHRLTPDVDEDEEEGADGSSSPPPSLPFDVCAEAARRLHRRVTDVVACAYPSLSPLLPPPSASTPSALTAEQLDSFAVHVAAQFDRAYRPGPQPLLPPVSSPTSVQPAERRADPWVVHRPGRALWRAIVEQDSEPDSTDGDDDDWRAEGERRKERGDDGESSGEDEVQMQRAGQVSRGSAGKQRRGDDEDDDDGAIDLRSDDDADDDEPGDRSSDDSADVALSSRMRQQKQRPNHPRT